ncbi:CPBP family intramembrane metalloprotease [Staphylococcus sp. ACRSN]|uniref:CPBP family intramembrane glutamic endopeptidase n=1 Tax=Staphylococcus sp. ACRSN TaxID=2918214 RepID=UPI001EF291BE|nr:type II CAAX endopeptidase family protein [Staphylococcus sp. ACRSN]MCG7338227.1 CPBP family intramembrane metalloprotease [Staphylococcus sp. ACRSN]
MKQIFLRCKSIVWKDFLIIISLFLILEILSVVILKFGSSLFGSLSDGKEILLSSLVQLLAYTASIFLIYILHIDDFYLKLTRGLHFIKRHSVWLMSVFVLMFVTSYFYNFAVQYLPGDLGFSETQNELQLQVLFENPKFLPFAFLLIVIAAPLIEEIIFRHLLIGELGKLLNFKVMGIVSAVLFSLMHVSGATSPFEFGSYIILATALVYSYINANNKLIVSFSLHMLNNFVSFIITMITLYY